MSLALDSEVMMALGGFKFAAPTAAYQELRRASAYRWKPQERLKRGPALQYVGPGEETIELAGVIYPAEFHSRVDQVAAMRAAAGAGRPLALIAAPEDGVGHILGDWVILRIEESDTGFAPGGSPRKIEFRLSLKRYGGDK